MLPIHKLAQMILLFVQPTDGLSWPSISFATLVAALLATGYILWRRYRSRQMLLQRVAELERLSAAGRAMVAAELDVTALCELIAQESGQVIDNETFQIGLFEDSLYQIMYWTINGRKQPIPQVYNLDENSGIVGWIRQTRQPMLIHDFQREMTKLPARPRYISDSPPRSAIFIPLISGDQVIGIMAAQSHRPNRFNEEDMRRLMILANQAAAAIAHAQLFAQERERASYLELVGKIARQVNAIQDLEEIFSQVVRLTKETFRFHPVSIFEIDPQTGEAVIQASSFSELKPLSIRLAAKQGLIGTAVSTQETIISNNTAEDSRFLAYLENIAHPNTTKAEIAIPLIVNNEVLGVLDVQSDQEGVFGIVEKMVLEALAAETAIAIDKARQLARQREQAWITTAQLQVAEALSRSNDLEEIVTAVTRLTPMLTGITFCIVLLWNEELECYQGCNAFGIDPETVKTLKQVRLRIGDWNSLDAVHVGQQALHTSKLPRWLKELFSNNSIDQVLLLPICAKAEMMGVAVVSPLEKTSNPATTHYQAPLNRREELLYNMMSQAGLAIEGAFLRTAQQEEAWVNTALLQVAEAVNNLTDLNEILDTIVRLVPMLVGVETSLILIWDDQREVFHAGPSHGIGKMGREWLDTVTIEQTEFERMTPKTADSRTPNSTYYILQLPPWLAKILITSHAHAFPLHARGRLVGAMLVGTHIYENGRTFSPRRLNILNGIAHQAATAVVNNHLYRESAERSRLEQEISVARQIQASLIPRGDPHIPGCNIASYWQAARQVSGDFYDYLELPTGGWGIVVADVADKGIPAALFMALSRTILRTVAFNRKDPAEVLMRVNELIDKDAQTDLFVTAFYAVWHPNSETLAYANGGHTPPLLLKRNGEFQLLKGAGMALGVLPTVDIERKLIRLEPGDTLIFYTDGVTEAMNEDNDEFGIERLRLAAVNHTSHPAAQIVQAITKAIQDHAGETAQSDDITLVVFQRHAE